MPQGKVGPKASGIVVGELTIDGETMSASLRGAPLWLTTYEFALLKALAERAGRGSGARS